MPTKALEEAREVGDATPAQDYSLPDVGRTELPGATPKGTTQVESPFGSIPSAPDEFLRMTEAYDDLRASLEQQITRIADAPIEVDTGRLVQNIDARFGEIRNRILDSALSSIDKTSMEMDAYFGSAGSDQRSAARWRMAASVKNDMMKSAFQTIAQVFDQNTERIVGTELEGARINAQVAVQKAQAIAGFTGQATSAYLGVLAETNKNYATRLGASVQWAQLQATMRGQDIQFAQAMKQLEVQERGQDLQAAVSTRGQDMDYDVKMRGLDVTLRGQDISAAIDFAKLKSDTERIQLERDKANLQASMMVWQEQRTSLRDRWVPELGGHTPSYISMTSRDAFGHTRFLS